jgi:hypothetical protein
MAPIAPNLRRRELEVVVAATKRRSCNGDDGVRRFHGSLAPPMCLQDRATPPAGSPPSFDKPRLRWAGTGGSSRCRRDFSLQKAGARGRGEALEAAHTSDAAFDAAVVRWATGLPGIERIAFG